MSLRTANNLEVLIHCYVSPEIHPRFTAPAVQAAIQELKEAGLIYRRGVPEQVYGTTKKGGFLLDYLLSVPLPIEHTTFVIPERQEV